MLGLELSQSSIPKQQNSHSNKKHHYKHLNSIKPHIKERKPCSKRQGYSPTLPNKKSSQNSRRADDSLSSKHLTEIYTELTSLKTEYKRLKTSYNLLINENNQRSQREIKIIQQQSNLVEQLEKSQKEGEKYRKNVVFLEGELERIRKECMKLLEIEKFRVKKLQETIQEKELMIAYLRSHLPQLNIESSERLFFQHTAPTSNYQNLPKISINHSISSIDMPKQINHVEQEDSLNFSKQKSKNFESIHSEEQVVLSFAKKRELPEQPSEHQTFQECLPENLHPNTNHRKERATQILNQQISNLPLQKDCSMGSKKRRKKQVSKKKRKSQDMYNTINKK